MKAGTFLLGGRSAATHSLLRIALRDQAVAQAFRAFNRHTRCSLDSSLPPDARNEHAHLVLTLLDSLDLEPESAKSFLLEWTRLLSDDVRANVIYEARAAAELHEAGLSVSPADWVDARGVLVGGELPTLSRGESVHTPGHYSRHWQVPHQTLSAWREALELSRESVVAGKVAEWSRNECYACVRILVLAHVLGSPHKSSSSAEQRLQYFEGTV